MAMHWRLPQYVVMAMERQAEKEAELGDMNGMPVEQYVADKLYEAIDMETVEELGAEFREAFFLPEVG